MHTYAIHSAKKQAFRATLFSAALFLFMCASVTGIFSYAGPIVLGTELNSNGTVEYLCMGAGCENYTSFSWSDK